MPCAPVWAACRPATSMRKCKHACLPTACPMSKTGVRCFIQPRSNNNHGGQVVTLTLTLTQLSGAGRA